MICYSHTGPVLYIYDFASFSVKNTPKKSIRDAVALSISTDEKVLAFANRSKEVNMIFVKDTTQQSLGGALKAAIMAKKNASLSLPPPKQ